MNLQFYNHEQGSIWVNSIVVTARQSNLVVIKIDTQQKYVDVGADMYSQVEGTIILFPDDRTLGLRKGEPRDGLDANTHLRVQGLPQSRKWSAFGERGRYTSTVVFYRSDPRAKVKRFDLFGTPSS